MSIGLENENDPLKSEPGEGTEETAAEDQDLAGRPDTPIPSQDELVEAMQWAFAGEEVHFDLLERFAAHARFVLEKNREVNLTAIVGAREMAAKHYLDSWKVTRFLGLFGKSVLDLGSGAGFPGIPIALADKEARFTLLDSTQKKVKVIEESIEKFGLGHVSAVWARGEDHLARTRHDVVLMRAVSSVRENVRTLRKVRHALKDLVMWKGPSWSREVRAGEREAERLGFKLDTVFEYKLPEETGSRAILVYRAPGAQGK
ncbi:MAG: 16S rRNA (guanine(527)-N(7))-methyltransferase RsmG [Planctomycetes bacterium]|nr:16S rRNA (guanine(527)-N(7))-methyltransferase RsmG [Planctomycetota bacterium]